MSQTTSELESRRVAEAAREKEWKEPSFLKELFLGRLRFDFIDEASAPAGPERPEFTAFFTRFKALLAEELDPVAIDRTGEYPPALIEGLRRIGAFGIKIPVEYGGLGFHQ